MLYYDGLVQARISAAERLRATVQSKLMQAIQNDTLTPEAIEGAAEGAVTAAIAAEEAEYNAPPTAPRHACTWTLEARAAAAAARAANNTATATPPQTDEGATASQASGYTPY